MREHKAHGPVKWIIPAVLPEGGWEQFPELHEFELWDYPAMKRLEKDLLIDCLQWWYLEIECLSRPGIPQIGLELRQQRIRCHCRNSCSLISTTGDYPKEESLGRRRGRRCIKNNGGVAGKDGSKKIEGHSQPFDTYHSLAFHSLVFSVRSRTPSADQAMYWTCRLLEAMWVQSCTRRGHRTAGRLPGGGGFMSKCGSRPVIPTDARSGCLPWSVPDSAAEW